MGDTIQFLAERLRECWPNDNIPFRDADDDDDNHAVAETQLISIYIYSVYISLYI